MSLLQSLWRLENGQDLVEYTLLLAFATLASAALITGAGISVGGIWAAANTRMGNVTSAAKAS